MNYPRLIIVFKFNEIWKHALPNVAVVDFMVREIYILHKLLPCTVPVSLVLSGSSESPVIEVCLQDDLSVCSIRRVASSRTWPCVHTASEAALI